MNLQAVTDSIISGFRISSYHITSHTTCPFTDLLKSFYKSYGRPHPL
jgi:hypothetical protein